jgi:hypothetical protein
MSARKNHVKFATMEGCPVRGCKDPLIVPKGGKPTVVGVKRHVRHWHPEKYESIRWPNIHAIPAGKKVANSIRANTKRKPTAPKTIDDLRKEARKKGINPAGMRKDELVSALS